MFPAIEQNMLGRLIKRPVAVTMVALTVVVLGVASIFRLPVSLIPDVDIPYVTVQISAQDMSARELDESVVRPLRRQLVQLSGLSDLVCRSGDGFAVIRLSFSHDSNLDYLFIEVNEKIDRAMPSLPKIDRPKVMKVSASDIPAFYINVSNEDDNASEEDFARLGRFVEGVICKRIEQLDPVAMVDVSGCADEEIIIVPDSEAIGAMGLSPADFENIITSADVRLGSLSVRDGQYRYNVKFRSSLYDLEDIGNIRFSCTGKLFALKDVAAMQMRSSRSGGLVRSNGRDAVCLAVIKQSDARMSDLKASVSTLTRQLAADYPGMRFEITRDQTALLDYSIRNLLQNILFGLLFATVVIFLFMRDFRSPALVCLTIPLALVFSMAVFYAAGLSANVISLSGLLLGVGMMTDNTVILIDNITARWQRGDALADSVIGGTKEVVSPMLSSVLTTCAVFIPLVFMNGMVGSLFRDQALAVTIVLLTSYLVTITVIPVYYYIWYRRENGFHPSRLLSGLSLHGKMEKAEEKAVLWLMGHGAVPWIVLGVSLCGAVICLCLMPKSQLPPLTETETVFRIDWNEQVSVEENTGRVAILEQAVRDLSVQTTSLVGIQQFLLSHSGEQGASEASIYLKCSSPEDLLSAKAALVSAIRKLRDGAACSFSPAENIFDVVFGHNGPELSVRLRPVSSSLKLENLNIALNDIRKALPDVTIAPVGVKTDMLFVADPELMALYGVSYDELASVLRRAVRKNRLFDLVQGSRVVPVLTGSGDKSLAETLESTWLVREDRSVPVSLLMRQTYAEDFKSIMSGAEGVYYPLDLDIPSDEVTSAMQTIRTVVEERGDFDVTFGGAWFKSRETVGELLEIFVIALILLYLILASQFESLTQPLLVMSEIVVDVFASLLVLSLTGISLNIMSLIGLVVISGIVINDSILKVDTINRLRMEGMPLKQSVLEAGRRRMKAIIMTSLTTVLAVVPFLNRGNIGDDLQYPMSVVIIAGLTVGTLASLLLLPALYYSVYNRKGLK